MRDGTAAKRWKAFKKAFHKQFLPKPFRDQVVTSWDNLHMEEGESIDDYNQEFWDYYLQVLPFCRVSKKMQLEKYRAGLNMKIQTQVNMQHFKDIQSLMHAATVASLVQMEDPSTLLSLQAGLPKKRKFDIGRF